MSVDSRYDIKIYAADGDTVYRFDTESIGSEAIQVWTTDNNGTCVKLVEGTDYTLFFDRSEQPTYRRGRVDLTVPLPSNLSLSLRRKTPIVNDLVVESLERFPAEEFEYMMDKVCFIQQELEGSLCNCAGPGDPITVCVPVAITEQPVNTIPIDTTVTFTVTTLGTAPTTYQWYEDDVLMVGETGTTLTVSADSLSTYYVIATNPCGEETSNSVIVTPACQQYECDAYGQAVLDSGVSAYYPMNITADLDGYVNLGDSRNIKDYSGTGNDLIWVSGGTSYPLATSDQSGITTCDGRVTDIADSPSVGILRSAQQGHTMLPIAGTGDVTVLTNQQAWSLGDLAVINIQWQVDGAFRVGLRVIWKLGNDTLKTETIVINQVNTGSQRNHETDMSAYSDTELRESVWGARMTDLGGGTVRTEVLFNFEVIATYEDGNSFTATPTQTLEQIGELTNYFKGQEQGYWNKALSDAELLTLKDAWSRNRSDYVDPDPNCVTP